MSAKASSAGRTPFGLIVAAVETTVGSRDIPECEMASVRCQLTEAVTPRSDVSIKESAEIAVI